MALNPAKKIPLRPKSKERWYISFHNVSFSRGSFPIRDEIKNSIAALITTAGPYLIFYIKEYLCIQFKIT